MLPRRKGDCLLQVTTFGVRINGPSGQCVIDRQSWSSSSCEPTASVVLRQSRCSQVWLHCRARWPGRTWRRSRSTPEELCTGLHSKVEELLIRKDGMDPHSKIGRRTNQRQEERMGARGRRLLGLKAVVSQSGTVLQGQRNHVATISVACTLVTSRNRQKYKKGVQGCRAKTRATTCGKGKLHLPVSV